MPKNNVSDPINREQVLARLWEIAHLSPDMTRGSVTGQVKALSMIVAMLELIPDRRALSSQKKSAPAPIHPQPSPATAQQEDGKGVPEFAPGSAGDPPPNPGPGQSIYANRFTSSEAPKPYVPLFGSVPDLGVALPVKNPFVRPPLNY
jgi:hypothetical protein